MSQNVLSSAFFSKNRSRLAALLPPQSMAIFFSNEEMPRNGDQFYPFRQSSCFYYFTGVLQERSVLLLCPGHKDPRYREILFIRDKDPFTDLWEGVKLTLEEASKISGIAHVQYISTFLKHADDIGFGCDEIFMENFSSHNESSMLSAKDNLGCLFIKNRFPLHRYGRLSPLIRDLRLHKSQEELMAIRQACRITASAFEQALGVIRPGVFEYEVEAEITRAMIRRGARFHAFSPVIATGINACSLHYDKLYSECRDGDLLLMDFGAELSLYASDCSRTVPVSGRFTPRQRALYDAVLRMFKRSRSMMVKGISLLQINRMLQTFWEEEHIALGLYSVSDLKKQDPARPLYKKYFPHTISHYIGLDIHDTGDREEPLEGGEVVSCEPGIYIPEEGIGIRLENTLLITQAEPIDLMADIPLEAEEIEEVLQKARASS